MGELDVFIIYFSIYSLIGWCCEVIYCSVLSKKFVNRGFLAGPVCPVYGFGALLVIYLLKPVDASIPVVFLCGLTITSVLEYFTSWLLEVFFNTKWWNYEKDKFNLNGRVCLKNSMFFGILSVVLMKVLYPFTLYIVGLLPDYWVKVLSISLTAVFAVDVVFTVNTLVNLNERLRKLSEFTEDLKKNADILEWFNESELFKSFEKLKLVVEEGRNELNHKLEEGRSELNHKLKEKFEALTERKGSGQRLIKAFPNMQSTKYNVQLNHLKDALKELKEKAKRK